MGYHPQATAFYGVLLKPELFSIEQLKGWLKKKGIYEDLNNRYDALSRCISLIERQTTTDDKVRFGQIPGGLGIQYAYLYIGEMQFEVCLVCDRWKSLTFNRIDPQTITQLKDIADRFGIVWDQPQIHLTGLMMGMPYSRIARWFYGLLNPWYTLQPSGTKVDTPPLDLLDTLKLIGRESGSKKIRVWFEEIPEKTDEKEDDPSKLDFDRQYLFGINLDHAIPANVRADWDHLLSTKCAEYNIPFTTPEFHTFTYIL
jgi:hypothetical protein